MFSMRYGTLPVVSRTGGLADTVDHIALPAPRGPSAGRNGTGFVLPELSGAALRAVVHDALQLWRKPRRWRQAQQAGMARDFSWRASVEGYLHVYAGAITKVRA